mgnify:CR=1 FL=1
MLVVSLGHDWLLMVLLLMMFRSMRPSAYNCHGSGISEGRSLWSILVLMLLMMMLRWWVWVVLMMMTIGRTNVLIVGDCTTNNSLAMSILGWMSRCSGSSVRLHVRFGKTHFILLWLLSRNVVTANLPRNTTICNSPILLKRNSLPPPRSQLWRTQPCIPLAWIGIRILNHLRRSEELV